MNWTLIYTSQSKKDAKKLKKSGLKPHAKKILEIIAADPFQIPPPYEKLVGDLQGAISRRISFQHRLVYQVIEEEQKIKIIRLWTHYE